MIRELLQREWEQSPPGGNISVTDPRQRERDMKRWLKRFKVAGFPTPDDPVTLYRGVVDIEHARGISWTSNKEMAEWFALAPRPFPHDRGLVLTTTALPEAVIAVLNEDDVVPEYIVDPSKLSYVDTEIAYVPEHELVDGRRDFTAASDHIEAIVRSQALTS